MARFALRLVELPTRDRKKLRELLRDHDASVSKALLDACEVAGELNAIVQEARDHEPLEAIQQRLASVGVVTALVERDAVSEWWRGL